jgi:hypothetical protein
VLRCTLSLPRDVTPRVGVPRRRMSRPYHTEHAGSATGAAAGEPSPWMHNTAASSSCR